MKTSEIIVERSKRGEAVFDVPSSEIPDVQTPLVSIVMLTYNHALLVTRAIEGVLNQQTDFPFELVIGEDCSTDGTREIVLEHEKKHRDIIRVIRSERNVGMLKNGYRTEKACRGKYVAWCDGDDYWHHPSKLQKQVDYMKSHPSCGLVYSNYDRYILTSGETIHDFNRTMKNTPPENPDISSILRGGKYLYILLSTAMARRNVLFEVIDGDPFLYQDSRFKINDTSRWAEIAWRSDTHYIDESLVTYSQQVVSGSKFEDPVDLFEFGKSNNELFLYLVEKYNLPASEFDYFSKKWCRYAIQLAFTRQDKNLAREVWEKRRYWSPKVFVLYCCTMNKLLNRSLKGIINLNKNMKTSATGR